MNVLPMRMTGRPKELFAAFGLALAFWSVLALFSGLFNGGFLLWDDIIIADLHAGLKSTGFADLYVRLVQKDLDIRLRPLAVLHYLTMARLYGLNYTALLVHNLVIASLACAFLYGAARNLGASIGTTVLFVAITCIGNQGVFALRLVLAENPGMLFLSISAWFLTLGKRLPSALFFLMAALTKESFVLLAPALIVADRMLPTRNGRSLFILLASLGSLLIVGLIVFRVGTHSIGYAGVDEETFSALKLLRSLGTVLFVKGYGLALLPVLLGLLGGAPMSKDTRSRFTRGILLCALVALPQVFLYAKSGIFMHYLLPALLWSSLAVLMLWNGAQDIAPKYHMAFRLLVLVWLGLHLSLLYRNARDISTWGREARMALEAVMEKTEASDTILIVGHPVRDYEKATDAARFLASDLYHRPHARILPTDTTDVPGTTHEQKLTRRFLEANRTFMESRTQLFQQASCILYMPGTLDTLIPGMDTMHVASYIIATPAHP